jgi:hypothetical protein
LSLPRSRSLYRVMKLEVILLAELINRTDFKHTIPNIIGPYTITRILV